MTRSLLAYLLAVAVALCIPLYRMASADTRMADSQERQEALGRDAVVLALRDMDQLYGQNMMLTRGAQESAFREQAWRDFAAKWKLAPQWDRQEKRLEATWRKGAGR